MYAKSIIYQGAPRYIGLISWELHMIMMGMLGITAVTAAYGLFMNYAYWCYTIPAGLSVAAGILIGN